MKALSEKVFLKLDMPNSKDIKSDRDRILDKLKIKYKNVDMPYKITKDLYPKCRESNFEITVTLVKRTYDWVVTRIEQGDKTDKNYGYNCNYEISRLKHRRYSSRRGLF